MIDNKFTGVSPSGYQYKDSPTSTHPFWTDDGGDAPAATYLTKCGATQAGTVWTFSYTDNTGKSFDYAKVDIGESGSGEAGKDGTTYTPHITAITGGNRLTWTNNGGLTNPDPVDIMDGAAGPQGPQGPQGEKGDAGAEGPQGPQGEKGATGADGKAATISVGTTTTGEAGTEASVTNSGTEAAAVFNFVIPKGEKGDTGPQGPQGPQGEKGDAGASTTLPDGTEEGQVLTWTGTEWTAQTGVTQIASDVATLSQTVNGMADGGESGQFWRKLDNTQGWYDVFYNRYHDVLITTTPLSSFTDAKILQVAIKVTIKLSTTVRYDLTINKLIPYGEANYCFLYPLYNVANSNFPTGACLGIYLILYETTSQDVEMLTTHCVVREISPAISTQNVTIGLTDITTTQIL